MLGVWLDVIGVYNFLGFQNWCSQNNILRLTLPDEVKSAFDSRMQKDPFQGAYSNTVSFSDKERRKVKYDLEKALAGKFQELSIFKYN